MLLSVPRPPSPRPHPPSTKNPSVVQHAMHSGPPSPPPSPAHLEPAPFKQKLCCRHHCPSSQSLPCFTNINPGTLRTHSSTQRACVDAQHHGLCSYMASTPTCCSQGFRQSTWNTCLHGSCCTLSPTASSSVHTGHFVVGPPTASRAAAVSKVSMGRLATVCLDAAGLLLGGWLAVCCSTMLQNQCGMGQSATHEEYWQHS